MIKPDVEKKLNELDKETRERLIKEIEIEQEEEEMSVAGLGSYSAQMVSNIKADAMQAAKAVREYGSITAFKAENPNYQTKTGQSLSWARNTYRLIKNKDMKYNPQMTKSGKFSTRKVGEQQVMNVKIGVKNENAVYGKSSNVHKAMNRDAYKSTSAKYNKLASAGQRNAAKASSAYRKKTGSATSTIQRNKDKGVHTPKVNSPRRTTSSVKKSNRRGR